MPQLKRRWTASNSNNFSCLSCREEWRVILSSSHSFYQPITTCARSIQPAKTCFDVYHNSFWYTSKQIIMYIKTRNILGFQFALVPLPPFRNLLFIRDSGWNPISQTAYSGNSNDASQLPKPHTSAPQMPVVCRTNARGLGSWSVWFRELRCVIGEVKSGFHPLSRINRRIRKGERGWHESNTASANNCNWFVCATRQSSNFYYTKQNLHEFSTAPFFTKLSSFQTEPK